MPDIFNISGDEISRLDDSSLRELVGLLCEAYYRSAGLSTNGIRWGGHQNAADGGFDVVLDSELTPPAKGFIKRRKTAFQVKKPDMTPNRIIEEMCPSGNLRLEIKGLIHDHGSYVIVSSTGSTTEPALKRRQQAMRRALVKYDPAENVHLDFFDRNRVATWVRCYPSLILWVKTKLGRETARWRPYGEWASAPQDAEAAYLLDEHVRLFDGTRPRDGGLSASQGINRLRTELSVPGQGLHAYYRI